MKRKLRLLAPLALALAAPLPAQAQYSQVSLALASGQPSAVGRDACLAGGNAGTAVTYDFPGGYVAGSTKLTLFATEASTCPDDPPKSELILMGQTTITDTNRSQTVAVPAVKLGGSDCPMGVEKPFLICAVVHGLVSDGYGYSTTEKVTSKVSVTVTYDTKWPRAVELQEATGGEGSLYLSWNAEDVSHFVAYYRPIGPEPTGSDSECGDLSSQQQALDGEDAGADAATPGPDAGAADASAGLDAGRDTGGYQSVTFSDGTVRSGVISGLTNDQEYEVFLVAVDAAGNTSPDGNVMSGTPRLVHDFYKRYRCRGGQETGGFGCSSAGMALLPLAGLAAAVLLRGLRRKA